MIVSLFSTEYADTVDVRPDTNDGSGSDQTDDGRTPPFDERDQPESGYDRRTDAPGKKLERGQVHNNKPSESGMNTSLLLSRKKLSTTWPVVGGWLVFLGIRIIVLKFFSRLIQDKNNQYAYHSSNKMLSINSDSFLYILYIKTSVP